VSSSTARASFYVRLAAVSGLGAALSVTAGACANLLGVDFEGRLAPSSEAGDGGAAVDAGSAIDADSSFCAGFSGAFCADFDQSDDVTSGWEAETSLDRYVTGGGQIGADMDRYRSFPRALRATLPSLQARDLAQAHLWKGLPEGARAFHVDFAFRIESEGFVATSGSYTIFQLAFRSTGGVTISQTRDATNLDVAQTAPDGTNVGGERHPFVNTSRLDVGKWHDMSVWFALPADAASEGELAVYLDGNPVANGALPYAVSNGGAPLPAVGLYGRGPLRETIVSFDNVGIVVDR